MQITCLSQRQFQGWSLRDASQRITLIALCAAHRALARGETGQSRSSGWGDETVRFFTPLEFKEVVRCAALRVRRAGTGDCSDEQLEEWCRTTSLRMRAALSVRAPGVAFPRPLDARLLEILLRRGCKLPELA